MAIQSQITPKEKQKRVRQASSTFSLGDVPSERVAACPEVTYLALEVDCLPHTLVQVGSGKFWFSTVGSLASVLLLHLSRDAGKGTTVTIKKKKNPHPRGEGGKRKREKQQCDRETLINRLPFALSMSPDRE